MQHNAIFKIRLEVDTDPPEKFETEAKVLLLPIPFTVNSIKLPDLFAGKVHALLERDGKTRVKGCDYFDFVWYVAPQYASSFRALTGEAEAVRQVER